MVTLKIDGREIQVQENSTVLEAALAAGAKIPTLCNLKDINQIGACRMCLVEDAKSGKGCLLCPACFRGDGYHHQFPQGPQCPPGGVGADPFRP